MIWYKKSIFLIENLSGQLALRITAAGSIRGNITSDDVKAYVRVGDIHLSGLAAGHLETTVWMGSIELVLQKVIKKASMTMHAYLGDITVFFPSYVAPRYEKGKILNAVNAVCRATNWVGDVKVGVIDTLKG